MKKASLLIVVLLLINVQFTLAQDFAILTDSENKPFAVAHTEILATDSQSKSLINDEDYPLSKFAMSFNPLGFIQFGPILNAEFALTQKLVLNTHLRFPTLGILSYVANEADTGDDNLTGIAFGGGLLCFFPGKTRSMPYLGLILEYDKTNVFYDIGEEYEATDYNNSCVFMINGGYRFRFDGGFFINTGAYFGTAVTFWNEEYSNSNSTDWGTELGVYGMLELTFGFEF